MAGKAKHAQRAHRSYTKNIDFSSFYRKARFKEAQKMERKSLADMLKDLLHKNKKEE